MPAVEVSMFRVTANPPPLVSLAVVVPGPVSSNGNRNFSVWPGEELADRKDNNASNGSALKNRPQGFSMNDLWDIGWRSWSYVRVAGTKGGLAFIQLPYEKCVPSRTPL